MLRIAKWSETFENAKTRKLVGLDYIHVPTGVDSAGYIELMSRGAEGVMAYAVFLAICQWSATCRPGVRGLIARSDGRPLPIRHLAMVIRMPPEIVQQAIDVLCSDDVHWLEVVNDSDTASCDNISQPSASHLPTISQPSATDLPVVSVQGEERRGEEGKGEEGKEDGRPAAAGVADATDPPDEQSALPARPVSHCPYVEIGSAFDAVFGGRSQLTDKRRKAMQARWRDSWWRDHWREALERAGPSAFLRGGNDRGWVIDLEFFLRPDTVAKILEGKYDNRAGTTRAGNSAAAREQRNADSLAIFERAAAAAGSNHGGNLRSGSQAIGFQQADT